MNETEFQPGAYLETLTQHFKKFDELTLELAKSEFSTAAFNELMNQVQTQSKVIQAFQSQHQTAYHAFLQSGNQLNVREKELASQLESRLKNLIGKYDEFEAEARDARAQLLPVVNENIRTVQMKSAYGRHT